MAFERAQDVLLHERRKLIDHIARTADQMKSLETLMRIEHGALEHIEGALKLLGWTPRPSPPPKYDEDYR